MCARDPQRVDGPTAGSFPETLSSSRTAATGLASTLRNVSLRSIALWTLLLTALLNFTPALFTNESVSEAAIWTKLLKDLPVVFLFGILLLEIVRRRRINLRDKRLAEKGSERHNARRWLAYSVSALAAFMLFSAFAVSSPSLGFLVSARYYVLYPLLAIALSCVDWTNREVTRLTTGIVAFGIFETIVAVPNFLGAFSDTFYAGHVKLAGDVYPRAIATLGNPNNLGMFLGLALVLTIWNPARLSGRVRAAAISILSLGIVLTFSKTVILALGITLLILAVKESGRTRVYGIAIASGAAFLVLIAYLMRTGTEVSETALVGTRLDTASAAFEQWTETPRSFLLGQGFAAQADVSAGGTITETVIDNMPLALAVEGGVVGLALFALVVYFGVRGLFLERAPGRFIVASRACVTFFIIYTPFAVAFRLFPGALFFWLIVGISLALVERQHALDRVEMPREQTPVSRATG